MVIFRITKEMPEKEYIEYSKRLVQQYEWCKQDKCMVVPEYVEVYIIDEPANPLVIDEITSEDLLNELVGEKRK